MGALDERRQDGRHRPVGPFDRERHVVLVDVVAGARISALRDIAAADPETPVLAVNVRDADADVLACIEAGAIDDPSLDTLRDPARALGTDPRDRTNFPQIRQKW